MTPMQILVLVLFAVVTFANTFIIQPDITWSPIYHALVISTDVTLFWVALNLQRFSEMGRKADFLPPAAPIDAVPPTLEQSAPVEAVQEPSVPAAAAAPSHLVQDTSPPA